MYLFTCTNSISMEEKDSTSFPFLSKLWPFIEKQKVYCESPQDAKVAEKGYSPFIKRADSDVLREIFNKRSSQFIDDHHYMTYSDFLQGYLGLMKDDNYNPETLKLLAGCVDTTKNGLISFQEFQAFEGLLCSPDAMYALAFQIFDVNSNGYITYDEFINVIKHTTVFEKIPFDFETEFMQLHFGCKRRRHVNYAEFTQLLHDFHEEHALQAFKRYDRDDRGFIDTLDFYEIMITLKPHFLTPFVEENIVAVSGAETAPGAKKVSYPFFTAFISLLNNLELIKQLYTHAAKGASTAELTKEDFLHEAQKYTQITPLEVDIMFNLVQQAHQDGRVTYEDLKLLSPMDESGMAYRIQALAVQEKVQSLAAGKGRGFLIALLENVYRFALGSVAGCVGATIVYPIDLVKTRMQNQRSGSYVGELMYKNSFDCFKKVLRHEGFFGLYRGLAPQLVGVAPEKAIKLTMNDLVRDTLGEQDGSIAFWAEMLAGSIAGGSQVMFTNPLEIVKIRLQVAGEVVSTKRIGAMSVIKELGFFGLYKGARACFLRDIPFSAIYFTAYAHMKKYTASENGYNGPLSLLCSATIAGAPAACLTTPADVIKTRLQVVAREGQTTYNGVIDCARKIWKEEGGRAFWKGAPARVLRSSPQFGFTLLTYELLQRLFYIDFGGRRPQGSEVKPSLEEMLPANPDHIGGYRLALAAFDGIETKFGLSLPKFQRVQLPESTNSKTSKT